MIKLIISNISKRKLQSTSLLLSVLLSVAVLLALAEVYQGVSVGIAKANQRLGADIMLVPSAATDMMEDTDLLFTGAPAPIYMNKDIVDTVLAINDVESVTVQFFGQTLSEPCCSPGSEMRLVGFDPKTDWIATPWLQKSLKHELADDEIIIGSRVNGFEDGTGYIRGRAVRVAGVMDQTGSSFDLCVFMNIDVVRDIMANADDYAMSRDLYGEAEDVVSTILINAKEGRTSAVSLKLRTKGDFKIITTVDVLDDVSDQMSVAFTILLGAAILMCVLAAFQIFGRFYTMTWERRNELGLYRALGASETYLKKLLLGEMLCFTLGGTVIGSLGGTALYKLLLKVLADQTAFPFVEPSAWFCLLCVFSIFCVFLMVGLLAVMVPLKQTSKIDPSVAMQKRDID